MNTLKLKNIIKEMKENEHGVIPEETTFGVLYFQPIKGETIGDEKYIVLKVFTSMESAIKYKNMMERRYDYKFIIVKEVRTIVVG